MKRFIPMVLVPVALLYLAAVLLDPVFSTIFKQGKGTKAQWLMNLREQRYDIAVLGSSRALWNISMAQLDSTCGTRSLNLANDHFTPAEMLLCMKLFLRNGNRVGVILIQIDHSSLTDEQNGFSSSAYEFLPYLDDTLIYEHLNARSDEWFWLKNIPFWRFVKYNFKWGIEQAALTYTDRRKTPFDSTGSYFSPNDNFYGKSGSVYSPQGHHLGNDLQELFSLCKANDIKVLPFTAPYHELRMPAEAIGAPTRVLAAHGIDLLDYSDSLQGREWFNDNKHINRKGGRRLTAMLTLALQQHGACPSWDDTSVIP
jgi:hypothetical protein